MTTHGASSRRVLARSTLAVALVLTQAPAARADGVRHVFLHGDWRLSPDENARMEQALRAVARTLGHDVVEPGTARPLLGRLRRGERLDGGQCAVPRTASAELLAALASAPTLCRQAPCTLGEATWSIECSARWDACVVDLRLRPPPGADASREDDDETLSTAHHSWRVPRAVAGRWKQVEDLARALERTRRRDWRQPGAADDLANVFGMGGLGLLGGLGDGEADGHRERAPAAPSLHLEVEREAGAREALWTLLARQDHDAPARRIELGAAGAACLTNLALPSRSRVFARRQGRGFALALEVEDQALRACLLPVLGRALADENRQVSMLNLDLIAVRGDVRTRDGQYLIELEARAERTQDRDWRKQKPRVSDPALADWRVPADLGELKRCLVDFPFSDDHALRDHQRRARLHLFYEVTFDAAGQATGARFLLPAKQGSPAEQLGGEARACIVRAALASTAPCSAAGGTARAWLTATTWRVAGPPSGRDGGASD